MVSDIQKQFVSRENLYSLGNDIKIGCHILSIPVSNKMVDYEEYYKLTSDQYDLFMTDQKEAKKFADECRLHMHDDLLTLKPGTDRGVPR
jgi:hypothetical protein